MSSKLNYLAPRVKGRKAFMVQFSFEDLIINSRCAMDFVDYFTDNGVIDDSIKGGYYVEEDKIFYRQDCEGSFVILHEIAHGWSVCPKAHKQSKVLSLREEEAVADLCAAAIVFAVGEQKDLMDLRVHMMCYGDLTDRAVDKAYKVLSKMCPEAQAHIYDVIRLWR